MRRVSPGVALAADNPARLSLAKITQSSPSRGPATTARASDPLRLLYAPAEGWRPCARAPHPPNPSPSPLCSSASTASTERQRTLPNSSPRTGGSTLTTSVHTLVSASDEELEQSPDESGCFYCAALRYIGCVLVDRSGTGSINKPCAIAANAFAELFVSFYLFDGSVLIASLRAFECVERFVMFFAIIRFSMYGLPISIAWDINHICQRGPWSSRCWLLPICYLFGNTRLLRFLSRGKWR